MVSNKKFSRSLLGRILVLSLFLIGFSFSTLIQGFIVISLLLAGISSILIYELYRYVNKSNLELSRFLEAARYGDYSQNFKASGQGAGFDQLSDIFHNIMQDFQQSRQEQEASLRHLKALTEHTPVPLLSLLPDDQVILQNNAARRLFGNVTINKTHDLKIFGNAFYDAIKTAEPGEKRLIHFSEEGHERQLAMVASQIITGNIKEKLISVQDIQNELDGAQLQAWQELVRVLTHEIMNSITPVASLAKTAADLAENVHEKISQGASREIVSEELEDMRQAVDTVARRSDSLMQFVQSYRSLTLLPKPVKSDISLSQLFFQLEKLVHLEWQTKAISLQMQSQPESLQLSADPDMIEQVLINLLKNAEQALVNVAKAQVSVSARLNQRGRVIIEVKDNGPGIPEDILGKVFIPFFTTKREGSGVGLALTRQIMIAHGGSVTVNNLDSGGAGFTLIF